MTIVLGAYSLHLTPNLSIMDMVMSAEVGHRVVLATGLSSDNMRECTIGGVHNAAVSETKYTDIGYALSCQNSVVHIGHVHPGKQLHSPVP